MRLKQINSLDNVKEKEDHIKFEHIFNSSSTFSLVFSVPYTFLPLLLKLIDNEKREDDRRTVKQEDRIRYEWNQG